LARKRTPEQPKLRTREHIVADLAVNHFERQALLCGFAVNRLLVDYGIDLRLVTFTSQGLVEAGPIEIQIKGTDKIRFVRKRSAVAWRISRSDLQTWLYEVYPVILVVYDAQGDVAYWVHIQDYFANLTGFNLFAAGATVTVRIPALQVLTPNTVRQFAAIRDRAKTKHQRGGTR
jgi:hypothetical protein